MKIKVPFYYMANVIMPRKRKSESVMVQDKVTVEIKEFRKEDIPVAFKVKNDDLPFELRTLEKEILFDGKKLWTLDSETIKNENNRTVGIETIYIDTVKKKTESGGENHKWSCSTIDAPFYGFWHSARYAESYGEKLETKKELLKQCRKWVDDNRKEVLKEIRAKARSIISIDNVMYKTASEPRYVVMTFGLGNNHGGTGMFVTDYYNRNICKNSYFTALQYNEAYNYAINVAKSRGDSESIDTIGFDKIEVLIPKAVKLNPNKEHGNGNEFLNSIENGIQAAGPLGGLVVALSDISQ